MKAFLMYHILSLPMFCIKVIFFKPVTYLYFASKLLQKKNLAEQFTVNFIMSVPGLFTNTQMSCQNAKVC